jgi:serine/threonine protein kinase/Tol biopolymer transport system component
MTLEQGTLLNGRYRIVDILGQGGMGSVYRAMDENLGMEVAVKENLFTTDEYSRQFRLEAVILASLRHPNLPRVTDHFVFENQGQYLVMDYIEGEDLRQRMERLGTIPEEDAILIGAAIADALSHLHTRKPPVLHRDIKPGNVKITPDGRVFLVDFGLAKLVQGSQTTTTGARAMTPGYSPPEQYGTARTDPRSDIYSLGATLYAALTGVIPEDGLARVMDNVQLTPIRKHNPKISRRLASAIEKAMEAYPDDRFQLADDFRHALLNSSSKTQRFTELDLNITVPPPPDDGSGQGAGEQESEPSQPIAIKTALNAPPTSVLRKRRRLRRDTSVIAWAALVLLLLAGWFLWNNNPAFHAGIAGVLPPGLVQTFTPQSVSSATPPPVVLPSNPTATPSDTPTIPPTPAPTSTPLGGGQGQMAFASDRTGIPQIWLMDTNGTVLRQITKEPDGACQPDWSPDGTRLVYTSPCRSKDTTGKGYQGSSLYIINVDGTGKVALPTTIGGDFDPAWSPDGKRIAFTSLRDGYDEIYMIDLDSNLVSRLTKSQSMPGAIYARMGAWSPFGGQIVYVLKRLGTNQIWVTTDADANSTKPNEQLVKSGNTLSDFSPAWSPDGKFIIFSESKSNGLDPAYLMSLRYEDRATSKALRLPIEPLPVVNAAFSPDGFWMAFESWPDKSGNQDIYIASVTGANRTRVTTWSGYDFDPAWRPLPQPTP